MSDPDRLWSRRHHADLSPSRSVVQIGALFAGRALAAALPKARVGFGKFSFELNPGPFSVKEHVAVVLAASTGGTNNLGSSLLPARARLAALPLILGVAS